MTNTTSTTEDGVPFTLDIPIHTISRLYAENVCRDAGMDMNRLTFLRWLFDHSVDHPEFTIVDMLAEQDG